MTKKAVAKYKKLIRETKKVLKRGDKLLKSLRQSAKAQDGRE